MFSYEYCEIFENIYFEEHLQTATSEALLKILANILRERCFPVNFPVIFYFLAKNLQASAKNCQENICGEYLFQLSCRYYMVWAGGDGGITSKTENVFLT